MKEIGNGGEKPKGKERRDKGDEMRRVLDAEKEEEDEE